MRIHEMFAILFMLTGLELQAQTISFFRQFTTPGMDRAGAVAASASGIYVLGSRLSSGGSPHRVGVRKYDARGNELWTRESASGPPFLDAAADESGFYMVEANTDDRSQLRKYSPDGDELFVRQLNFFARAVALDASGVYVTGRGFPPDNTYVRKYDPNGVELWTSRFGDRNDLENPYGLAADSTGVYLLAIGPRGGTAVALMRKLDPAGRELWNRELGLGGPLMGVAAARSGFYVVLGDAANYSVRKYSAAGDELWRRQIGFPISFYAGAVYTGAIAADTTGVYVVSGTNLGEALPGQCASGSGGDFYVRKYDTEGTEVWTRQFGTPDATWASDVAVDGEGVYVAGQEGTAQVRDDLEHFDAFARANPSRSAFLVKFEKTAAVATSGRPRIFPSCVVNAASYVGGGVAPGEIVTIFGSGMGPSEPAKLSVTSERRLATTLAGVRILFDGMPAPLVYVSEKQSSVIVPYGVAGRSSVDVQIEYNGVRSDAVTVPVLASRPGIFSLDGTGRGQALILNEDGTLNSAENPARRGSIVTLFGTGGGETATDVADGQIVGNVLPRTTLPVSAIFDLGSNEFQVSAKPGEVLYAGGVSGSVAGLLQLNVRVPANAVATGNRVPFLLIIGSHWTVHQVTIALR